MAVKDYLAYLSGECLLNVEKIGSGNWYWSFPADAKRQKENLLNDAKKERDKLNAQVEGLKKVQEEAIRVKEEEGIDEEEKERDKVRVKEAGERLVELGRRKEELVRQLEGMEGEVVAEGEVKSWADKHNLLVGKFLFNSPAGYFDFINDSHQLLYCGHDWKMLMDATDNIFSLMAFINETSGGDREKMAAIRQAFGIEEDMDYIEV